MTKPRRDPGDYDKLIVGFSGGKDSLACALHLLEEFPALKDRVELWHHDVDGREGSQLMDWPVTASYCRAVARAIGLPLKFQWKIGGFEGEMLREEARTKGVRYEETPGGKVVELPPNPRGKKSTRRKFPQVSADLNVRWCSAYLKIDVAKRVVKNTLKGEPDRPIKVLMVTGERAQESSARKRYSQWDSLGETRHRHFHQWRPVHGWSEEKIWEIIKRWNINPHPAYHLGWGRVSCAACIFGNADQWASLRELMPTMFEEIALYEEQFGLTIHRDKSVRRLADAGNVYPEVFEQEEQARLAKSRDYPPDMAKVPEGEWKMPAGAFRACGGPI